MLAKMSSKKILAIFLAGSFLSVALIAIWVIITTSDLPKLVTIEDYKAQTKLVSEVFDRNGDKIGEYFREKRLMTTMEEIPEKLVQAFVAAEDSSFYEHNGINYMAIFRAALANIKARAKVQGASTITQQVVKSLFLTREKTYSRKIKEVILAYRMEETLSKKEIMYLYVNTIYLGQGAYGVKMAAKVYFRKALEDLSVGEYAILAGLPKAPSAFSPIRNPKRAKERQSYVLGRMAEEGFITEAEAKEAIQKELKVYVRKDFEKDAPFFLETVRQILVSELGDSMVFDRGIKVYTSLDIKDQIEAQKQLRLGLRDLDKRQGFRGAKGNITDETKRNEFLLKVRNDLMDDHTPIRVIQADGSFPERGPLNLTGKDENGEPLLGLPDYLGIEKVVEAVVTKIDDKWGLVEVWFAENKGLIDFETMKWARTPNPKVKSEYDEIKKPSEALKIGDIIEVKIVGRKFYSTRINKDLIDLKKKLKDKYEHPADLPDFGLFAEVELEQEPITQGGLISFDQNSGEIIAMVGGRDFELNKYDKTYQSARQTGSSFKALVYASALDKGFTPSTRIIDSPLVFEEESKNEETESVEVTKWKPSNYDQKFKGDILFRNALIRSLNIPTVKIIEKVSVDWVAQYARRLGIISPLNMDFTLALGSSGVTLYEMTKVFSQFGRLGQRIIPQIIKKVTDGHGNVLLENISLDTKFAKEYDEINSDFEKKRLAYLKWKKRVEEKKAEASNSETPTEKEKVEAPVKKIADNSSESEAEATGQEDVEINPYANHDFSKDPPFYFNDPDQLIDPKTAYVTTSILQGVIEEPGGTGGRARALGRPAAGKTGTTSDYFDAWFIGYTPDIATGVWVGYEQEKPLGVGEGGGKTALPIWLEYMKFAHEGMPVKNFAVPEGIVFANIDNETGQIASASSDKFVNQAFIEGTEPQVGQESSRTTPTEDVQDFFKEDLSE